MTSKLIRIGEVEDRVGCKKSKIYEMISRGRFPRPVKIDKCSVWPEIEIEGWITDCIDQRALV